MQTSDWGALPASSIASIAKLAGSTASIALVCKSWHQGVATELHPTIATADLSKDELGPLPAWCQSTVRKVQLVIGPVPLSPTPCATPTLPDHFGPGDARELCITLARLELAAVSPLECHPASQQATKASDNTRTLRLCMCGTLAREQVLADLLLHSCPGLLDAWPQVEVVFEASSHTPDDPVQEHLQHSVPLPAAPLCASVYMQLCGSLATHLTVCQLSTGFLSTTPPGRAAGLQLAPDTAPPAASLNWNLKYPHLRSLGLCIVDEAVAGLPAGTGIIAHTLPAPSAWTQLLQGTVLPSLQSLALHTGQHIVQLPASCVTGLTTLESLVVTGAGLDVIPFQSSTASTKATGIAAATAGTLPAGGMHAATGQANVARCIAALPRLSKLRYDGFATMQQPNVHEVNSSSVLRSKLEQSSTVLVLVGAMLGPQFKSTPLPRTLTQLTIGMMGSSIVSTEHGMEINETTEAASMQLAGLSHLTLQVVPTGTAVATSTSTCGLTLDLGPAMQRAPNLQSLLVVCTPGPAAAALSSVALPESHKCMCLQSVLSGVVVPAVYEVLEPAPELSPSGAYDYPGELYPKQQTDTGNPLLGFLLQNFLQPLVAVSPQLRQVTFLQTVQAYHDQQQARHVTHRCPVRNASDLRHAFPPSPVKGSAAITGSIDTVTASSLKQQQETASIPTTTTIHHGSRLHVRIASAGGASVSWELCSDNAAGSCFTVRAIRTAF